MLAFPPGWHLREWGVGRSFQELRQSVVSTFLFSCELESAAKPIGFIHLLIASRSSAEDCRCRAHRLVIVDDVNNRCLADAGNYGFSRDPRMYTAAVHRGSAQLRTSCWR